MFSQTSEYALRAAVCLAREEGGPLTTSVIAERTRVPQGYLSKVLQLITRAGLISATRGLHGGYSLARSADAISILDVVNAVDPIERIHTCPLNLPEHGVNLCPLHRRMDEAIATVQQTFASASIAEMLLPTSGSVPLCPGPGAKPAE